MPMYEYECEKCGRFEVRQSMMDEHVAACPACGRKKTRRVYSVPSVKVMSDSEISARLMGVPKKRLDESKRLRDERVKRKRDPQSQVDLDSNELHVPKKKSR